MRIHKRYKDDQINLILDSDQESDDEIPSSMQNSKTLLTSDDEAPEDDFTGPYEGRSSANNIGLNDDLMDIEPSQKTVRFEIPEPSPEPSPEPDLFPVSEQLNQPSPEPSPEPQVEPQTETLNRRMNISFLCNLHSEDPNLRQSTISDFFNNEPNSVLK